MTIDLFGQTGTRRAMGSHQSNSGGTDEWLTPPWMFEELGPFDLDPCSPIRRPWPTAREHYTLEDDGLRQPWHGLVWLNPPYAQADRWMARLADHGDGIALLFARTETVMWHTHIWPHAAGILFLKGRLKFHLPNGTIPRANSGAPSALIAYGQRAADLLSRSDLDGAFVTTQERP